MPVPDVRSDEHKKLRDLLRRHFTLSEEIMSSRHDQWRRMERAYRLFVDPEEIQAPRERVTAHDELLYTTPASIVIPMSYAITQTVIAFWLNLFTNQPPYMRVEGRNPESVKPAKAQELLLSYQLERMKYVMVLFQWLLDACRFGIGVVKCMWDVSYTTQTIRSTIDIPTLNGVVSVPIMGKEQVLDYEGNDIEVVDPYEWRPDPRFPVQDFQKGAFCGQATYRSYFSLLRKQKDGIYENVDEIPDMTNERLGKMDDSERERIMGYARRFGYLGKRLKKGEDYMVLIEESVLDLVPKEVGLSQSEDVERWIVTLANRSTIIRAEPWSYNHGQFPYVIIESSPDKHSVLNPGLAEIMEPIAQHITWLYNSHLDNVRKALNDMFIIDPLLVNIDDILNPQPGKFIRINEAYAGRGVEGAMKQFEVTDITSQNIASAQILQQMLERVSSATDVLQGQIEEHKRSATEVAAAAQQGAQRLRMMAKLISAEGHVPLAKQMVQNNMQFLSQEVYIRLVGALENEYQGIGRAVGGGRIVISPDDIQGLYDFPINDGSAPMDPVRFAETWLNLARLTVEHPILSQAVDHVEIFKRIAFSLGINDVSRLLLPQQAQVLPDQQIAEQVQAGNLVPLRPIGAERGETNGREAGPVGPQTPTGRTVPAGRGSAPAVQ